jgi:tetratricopeptide (TPR) repeat protein
MGDFEAAMAELEHVPDTPENASYLAVSHGSIHLLAERYEQALQAYVRAKEVGDLDRSAQLGIAVSHWRLGDKEQALTVWRDLIDADERHGDIDWLDDEYLLTPSVKQAVEEILAALNK